MIRNAYLAPTESVTTLAEVKRALLTYDRVYLADPADRDLIPPQAFASAAFGMPMPFSYNTGPVRELGKLPDYDAQFDRLVDELREAVRSGCVEVVSSYDLETSKQAVLGSIMLGDYPLNPMFMLHAYRSIAREQLSLETAISHDILLSSSSDDQISLLSIGQNLGDGGINDDPNLPLIQRELKRDHLREDLSNIARARIASTMKSIGYCATKELVPIFANANYRNLVGHFTNRALSLIDHVAEHDEYWQNRGRALSLAHDEYLDEGVLEAMSIAEVLKLRDRAWGQQAEARDSLMKAVAEITRDGQNRDDFDQYVKDKSRSYRTLAEDVSKQRSGLSFQIICELIKGGLGTGSSLTAGAAASGMLSQVQTALGAGTILMAGCLWAVEKVQELKPIADTLRMNEEELKGDICFGLHDFYRRIEKG